MGLGQDAGGSPGQGILHKIKPPSHCVCTYPLGKSGGTWASGSPRLEDVGENVLSLRARPSTPRPPTDQPEVPAGPVTARSSGDDAMPTCPRQKGVQTQTHSRRDIPTGIQGPVSAHGPRQSQGRATDRQHSNLRKKMGAASPGPSSASPWPQPRPQPASPRASC